MGTERILLVDDEPDVTRILTKRLGKRGYTCAAAGNGQEALDMICLLYTSPSPRDRG